MSDIYKKYIKFWGGFFVCFFKKTDNAELNVNAFINLQTFFKKYYNLYIYIYKHTVFDYLEHLCKRKEKKRN